MHWNIWSFGGSIFSDTLPQQVNIINTKESIDALSFMVDMIHKYKITSNEITVYSSGDVRESFLMEILFYERLV